MGASSLFKAHVSSKSKMSNATAADETRFATCGFGDFADRPAEDEEPTAEDEEVPLLRFGGLAITLAGGMACVVGAVAEIDDAGGIDGGGGGGGGRAAV